MSTKHVMAAMMSVSLSTVGCLAMPSDEELAAMDVEMVGYETQDNPTGGGTTNELLPAYFHDNKWKLFNAMAYPLAAPGSHDISSNVINTGIMATAGGRIVLKKATECALSEGQFVNRPDPLTIFDFFYGQGLMNTTAGWFSGSLTIAQREDVLRCVVARLNMDGQEVPIVLSGQNVTNKAGENHDGVSPDALFDVKISHNFLFGYTMGIYVWPLASVGGSSSGAVSQCNTIETDITNRVCDDDPSNCGLSVSDDAEGDCYHYNSANNPEGYFKCGINGHPELGRPVVQTWAAATTVHSFYPSCYPALAPYSGMNIEYIPYEPYSL